jgi:hypothetical protein
MSNFPASELSKLLKDQNFIVKNFGKIQTEEALKKIENEKYARRFDLNTHLWIMIIILIC